MSDVEPSQPTPRESVQSESFTLDLSELNPEQVDELRRRLREVASGFGETIARQPGEILREPTHSSHSDSDGWI
jgi:hypothetical protein